MSRAIPILAGLLLAALVAVVGLWRELGLQRGQTAMERARAERSEARPRAVVAGLRPLTGQTTAPGDQPNDRPVVLPPETDEAELIRALGGRVAELETALEQARAEKDLLAKAGAAWPADPAVRRWSRILAVGWSVPVNMPAVVGGIRIWKDTWIGTWVRVPGPQWDIGPLIGAAW